MFSLILEVLVIEVIKVVHMVIMVRFNLMLLVVPLYTATATLYSLPL